MKNTLALAVVLLTVAACSSEGADDATFTDPSGTDPGTGSPQLTSSKPGAKEICGDGVDNDGNGKVDDGCACEVGATQKCFVGDPAKAGTGDCTFGAQTCVRLAGSGEFTATGWGPCEGYGTGEACEAPAPPAACKDGDKRACMTACGTGNETCAAGVFAGCDAQKPASNGSCPRKVNLNVDGDCVCAPACPADTPYIVGCKIDFQGSNTNGCVAPAQNGRIYFQEGVKCDSGHLSGYVLCSSVQGGPLDQNNCPINKSDPHFGSKPSKCPTIESGTPDSCYF